VSFSPRAKRLQGKDESQAKEWQLSSRLQAPDGTGVAEKKVSSCSEPVNCESWSITTNEEINDQPSVRAPGAYPDHAVLTSPSGA